MLTESELAKVLASWKKECGVLIKDHYCVPVNRPDRLAMYKTLINTLINKYAYEEADLEGNTERRVVEASVNPTSDNREKWRIVCIRDWKDAVDDFFPKEMLSFDPATVPERKRQRFEQNEPAIVDPRLDKDNPIDKSLFEELPPVVDPVDEEFLKLLNEVGDE